MSKFKVGDRVRLVIHAGGHAAVGEVGVIDRIIGDGRYYVEGFSQNSYLVEDHHIELVKKGAHKMGRRTFKLLKDTPELKKGGIVQEMCDDGTQDFKLIDGQKFSDGTAPMYHRDVVLKQPGWFEEVFNPADMWLTKDELDKVKSALKVKAKKYPQTVTIPFTGTKNSKRWTPERRRAQSRKLKAYHAKRRRLGL